MNRLLQMLPPEGLLGKDTSKARVLIDVDLGIALEMSMSHGDLKSNR